MWILETDSDVFNGKRLWLRPGKKYLFGRTSTESGSFAVESKSISRKHLVISVAPTREGDGSHIFNKSEVTIEDLGSKIGSVLYGERFHGQVRSLDTKKDLHEIQLGRSEHIFRVKWQPVVFTVSLSTKDMKLDDPLVDQRSKLEALDIKSIVPYVVSATTHVVATKPNTAKGLQALLNAKYIVDNSFLDAVVAAAAPTDAEDPDSKSLLEIDFDKHWPDELEFLPSGGKDAIKRDISFFAPNPSRISVFEGYTFIFCDQVQFDALSQAINNGGGKTLLFNLIYGQTRPNELVSFFREAQGIKSGMRPIPSEGGKVVIVKFRGKQEMIDWAAAFITEVCQTLDHRMIEQSEFLDALLANDAKGLSRALEPPDKEDNNAMDVDTASGQPKSPQNQIRDQSEVMEVQQPSPFRSRNRGPVISRFTGFDDEDSTIILAAKRQTHNDSDSDEDDEDDEERLNVGSEMKGVENSSRASVSRKRTSPPSDGEDEARLMDSLLPGAAAMKRRRIDAGQDTGQSTIPSKSTTGDAATPAVAKSRTKKKKEIDVLEAAREHKEAEEAAAREAQESYATVDGEDISQLRDLALVENMDLPTRRDRPRKSAGRASDDVRWEEKWDGRKNFKKFRRPGARASTMSRSMVALEEAKRKDYGIGEDYWVGESEARESSSHARRENSAEKESSPPLFLPESQTSLHATASSQPRGARGNEDDEDEGASIQPTILRSTKASSKSPKAKRPAAKTPARAEVSKRQKRSDLRRQESDDSGDELRFIFRSK